MERKFVRLFIYLGDKIEWQGFETANQNVFDKQMEKLMTKYSKLPKGADKLVLKVNNKTVFKLPKPGKKKSQKKP